MIFKDRFEAGRKISQQLKNVKRPFILAIPRGGVVLGAAIAKKLKCPLSIIVARKLGAPDNPELAIGAVTADGDLFLDQDLIDRIGVRPEYIMSEQEAQMKEAERREKAYRQGLQRPNLKGKAAILVDDGLATGATMEAAIRSVKREGASKVIIAVPVSPRGTVEHFKGIVDDIIVLSVPSSFLAIGQFYSDFPQVSDEEVISLLKKSNK
ncbi:MAG: phosphoribosyltransferase [Candidatus Woykebacteria bacterium]